MRDSVGEQKENMYRFTQDGPFTRQGLEEVRQLATQALEVLGPGGGYDEHALNVLWDEAGPVRLNTLPTRYNWPTSFGRIQDHEAECRRRAGGAPRILHANREVNR